MYRMFQFFDMVTLNAWYIYEKIVWPIHQGEDWVPKLWVVKGNTQTHNMAYP